MRRTNYGKWRPMHPDPVGDSPEEIAAWRAEMQRKREASYAKAEASKVETQRRTAEFRQAKREAIMRGDVL